MKNYENKKFSLISEQKSALCIFNADFFSSPAVPVNEGKDMRYMAILLIWLAFLDIVILGLNSDSPHGLTHIVVSWIIIMACIVIIIVMRKKGHKNADR